MLNYLERESDWMIDFLSFIISFFLLCFLVLIVLVGIKFFHNLANVSQSNSSYDKETDNQLRKNSNENSQADLYMSEENPDDDSLMFPEEFDGDDG